MFYADNYQLSSTPTTNNRRVERRAQSLSSDVFMRRSEGEGTGLVRGEAGVVFDKLYLKSHGSRLTGVGGENIVNAMHRASQPAQWKDIFSIVAGM